MPSQMPGPTVTAAGGFVQRKSHSPAMPAANLSQEKRQQVSTEDQDGGEGDNHQWDVVEFPGAVGATVEDNRDDEDEHTTRQRDAGFGQAHRATPGPGRVDAAGQRLLAETATPRSFDPM
jgi:hypothetical protein